MSSVSQPAAATAAADRPAPVVHLYTICWDEADMLGFFFRHYDPWVSRYVIYDDGSTDGSREILARHPRVELRNFDRTDPDSFVLSHKAMQDHVWKESRGVADWVVITAIDEHLHVPGRRMADYLAEQARAGVTLVPALGFDMNAPEMPADCGLLTETVTRGRPRIGFNKLSLFRPDAIAETGFGPGRHAAEPSGDLVLPERDAVMLWHYKHLGFARNAEREASQALRLGRRDITQGYGQHYLWSCETLRAFWDEMEAEATDLSAPDFSPEAVCKRPLWWRPEAPVARTRPKVSVLIKAYNHAAYVAQTIRSVLDQSFQDFEIVATDDGSDDGTLDILRGFDDPRIDLQAHPANQGISGAMNATLARANGDYCAILNSDDWALPERLARQVAFLDANPEIDAVFGMPEPVDEQGAPTQAYNDFTVPLRLPDFSRRSWLRQFFFAGNCLCAPTAMIRRSAYDRAGLYDPRLTNLQDLDMWVRMLVAGCRLHVLPEPFTAFRIRDAHANASAPSRSALLRAEFEHGRILDHYRAFATPLFDEVFGSGEPDGLPADASMPTRLGELALRVPRPSYRAFGLDCLYRAATRPEEIARLRDLTGSIDHFGEFALAERDNRIADLHAALRERDARIAVLEAAVSPPVRPAEPNHPAAERSIRQEAGGDDRAQVACILDPDWYRAQHPDLADLADPVGHYLAVGAAEGRSPHPLFDPAWYDRDRPASANPLLDFLDRGHALGRDPHPLFDVGWYLEQNPDVRAEDFNSLVHYIAYGAREGRSPHPLFDVAWYRDHNRGRHGDNPLVHYVTGQGTHPHPLFDDAFYRAAIPDRDSLGMAPLAHYVVRGAAEGRDPNPFFASIWYVDAHETLRETGRNPLVHYLLAGMREGRDPHPLFDSAFYAAQNPDVVRSGMNLLVHYLCAGRSEGRPARSPDRQ